LLSPATKSFRIGDSHHFWVTVTFFTFFAVSAFIRNRRPAGGGLFPRFHPQPKAFESVTVTILPFSHLFAFTRNQKLSNW
jgi:hypothetical protein